MQTLKISIGTYDDAKLGLINNTMLVVADYSKLGKETGFGISE